MINITEKQLRDTLQTELGSEGVWNYDLENEIVRRIKALSICGVAVTLKDKYKTDIEELEKELKKLNEESDFGLIEPQKWNRRTSFIKGKLSVLFSL